MSKNYIQILNNNLIGNLPLTPPENEDTTNSNKNRVNRIKAAPAIGKVKTVPTNKKTGKVKPVRKI